MSTYILVLWLGLGGIAMEPMYSEKSCLKALNEIHREDDRIRGLCVRYDEREEDGEETKTEIK